MLESVNRIVHMQVLDARSERINRRLQTVTDDAMPDVKRDAHIGPIDPVDDGGQVCVRNCDFLRQ